MNVVDRAIESLRERWHCYARECNTEQSADYRDGFRCGLRQAAIDVEHTLRGLSTFEGGNLPDPKSARSPIWCIPMMWDMPAMFSATFDPDVSAKTSRPRLELQRIELGRDQWGWLVRPQVWAP